MDENTKNKPHNINVGRVQVAVWKNENTDGDVYFQAGQPVVRYRDGDDWKDGTSFSASDCRAAAKAMDIADTYIESQKRSPAAS